MAPHIFFPRSNHFGLVQTTNIPTNGVPFFVCCPWLNAFPVWSNSWPAIGVEMAIWCSDHPSVGDLSSSSFVSARCFDQLLVMIHNIVCYDVLRGEMSFLNHKKCASKSSSTGQTCVSLRQQQKCTKWSWLPTQPAQRSTASPPHVEVAAQSKMIKQPRQR